VELNPAQSALYKALCNALPSSPTECRYQSEVVLDATLPCSGLECTLDTVRVVGMNETGRVFYEYVQPPCVQFPFFEGGLEIRNSANANSFICGNPRLAIAGEACCTETSRQATNNCNFDGERLTYATAKARCATRYTNPDAPRDTCDFTSIRSECFSRVPTQWSNVGCQVNVKVANDGRVLIVHDLGDKTQRYAKDISNLF
jgi:hypothetical protein